MHVAFDETIFAVSRVGGVVRYFVELATELRRLADVKVSVVAPLHVTDYLRDSSLRAIGIHYGRGRATSPRGSALVNRLLARPILRALQPDVVHETHYRKGGAALRGCPTVVTVYDMIHEKFPSYFANAARLTELKRASVERADRIVCISEQTRADLIEIFGVAASKIAVTYLASSMARAPGPDVPPSNYVLYVGARDGYKNFDAVLQVLPRLRAHHAIRLVAFGGGPFTAQEQARMRTLGLREGDVENHAGDDDALERLYAEALAFVCPSLYEGFGIPVVEAMAMGCPVVCSTGGSLREVAGDAAERFEPSDPDALLAALLRVVEDSGRRPELRRAGYLQASRFSWRRCAEETAAVYRAIA